MNLDNHLFLDIETIPSQLPWVREYAEGKVKPPKTIKKQEKIDEWYLNDRHDAIEEMIDGLGFDGASNHIVSIGCAVNYDDPVSFDAATIEDEAKIIQSFFEYVVTMFQRKYPIVVGHNVAGFDLRVIRQRATILGIRRPACMPWAAKPWDNNPFDTMVQWDPKKFVSQDLLARAFGLRGKGDVDGSKVYDMWKAGESAKIGDYCRDDVAQNREIFMRWHGIQWPAQQSFLQDGNRDPLGI